MPYYSKLWYQDKIWVRVCHLLVVNNHHQICQTLFKGSVCLDQVDAAIHKGHHIQRKKECSWTMMQQS